MTGRLSIRELTAADWPDVRRIYQEGIATRMATFETSVPQWETWHAKHLKTCRLVAESTGSIVGWAALSPVSSRCVYAGVAEVSVYVADEARGQGVGFALLSRLVTASEQAGLWTLQAGIMKGNAASIALHAKCGFRVVGHRERLGQLNGEWRDVILMERRSQIAG